MKKYSRKRSVNMVSSLVLYIFGSVHMLRNNRGGGESLMHDYVGGGGGLT